MFTSDELRDLINSTNLLLEELLYEAVETVSLEHLGALGDPEVAFSQILNQYLPEVREITKSFNADKLFTSKDKRKLQSKIDIRKLDSALIIPLLKIEDILGIKRNLGKCTSLAHQKICCEDCNANCDHSSPICKKCKSGGGTRSKSCKHECRKCKRTSEQCGNESKLCCSNCNICMDCNKELANLEVQVLAHMAVTSSQKPCASYLLLFCLEILLKWRNLCAHMTTQQLQDFINDGTKLKGFEICGDNQQLFSYFKAAFLVLIDNMRYTGRYKVKPLQESKSKSFRKDLENVLSKGEKLKTYLETNYRQLTAMLERMSIEFESQQSSINLPFTISADAVCSPTEDILKQLRRDVKVDGTLRGICHRAVTETIDQCLAIKYKTDYKIKRVDCELLNKTIEKNSLETSIGFKLTLDKRIFSEELQDEFSEDSKNMRNMMKQKIENEIVSLYQLNAELIFDSWECGSLVIKGEVVIMHGEVTALQKGEILDMIKEYALTIFKCDGRIEQIQSAAFDYSDIKFSLTISSTNDVLRMIENEADNIKENFIEKVKTKSNKSTSGKVEKETDEDLTEASNEKEKKRNLGSTKLFDVSELKFENVPVDSEEVKKEVEEDAGLQQQLMETSGSSQSVKKKSSADDNDGGSRDKIYHHIEVDGKPLTFLGTSGKVGKETDEGLMEASNEKVKKGKLVDSEKVKKKRMKKKKKEYEEDAGLQQQIIEASVDSEKVKKKRMKKKKKEYEEDAGLQQQIIEASVDSEKVKKKRMKKKKKEYEEDAGLRQHIIKASGTGGKMEKETDEGLMEASNEKMKKGKLAKKFPLTINIHRNNWLPYVRSEEEFSSQDCSLTGPLLKIFYDTIIKILEEKNIRMVEDFTVGEIHCDLLKKSHHTGGNISNFDFKMHVREITSRTFPLHHSNAMNNETQRIMHGVIKNAVSDIRKKFGYKAYVCFNKWGFGSPNMQGTVSLKNDKVNLNEQIDILDTICRVTKNLLPTDEIYIELLQNMVDPSMMIEFTIALLSEDSVVINTLKREKFDIERSFFGKVHDHLLKGSSQSVKKKSGDVGGSRDKYRVQTDLGKPGKRIYHHIDVDGKRLTFDDVWRMLEDKDFSSFKSIIIDVEPNRINNLRDEYDRTFLMYAIADDDVDICEYLTSTFTEQIDCTAKDDFGNTAFHYAAYNNNIDVMNFLIANDRRGLEIRNDDGETPLFYAARENHKSMVKLLLQNGVDPHAKDLLGRTADQDEDVNEDVQTIIQNYQTKNASTGTS